MQDIEYNYTNKENNLIDYLKKLNNPAIEILKKNCAVEIKVTVYSNY